MKNRLYADDKIMETITAEDVEYFKECNESDILKIASRWWTATKGCYVEKDDMYNLYLAENKKSFAFNFVCEFGR